MISESLNSCPLHAVCKSAVRSRETMSLAFACWSCSVGVSLSLFPVLLFVVSEDVDDGTVADDVPPIPLLFLPRLCLKLSVMVAMVKGASMIMYDTQNMNRLLASFRRPRLSI